MEDDDFEPPDDLLSTDVRVQTVLPKPKRSKKPLVRTPGKNEPIQRHSDESLVKREEDELFREHFEVMLGAGMFGRVDPNAPDPPKEMLEEYGEERAKLLFRYAKYALAPTSQAPVGLAISQRMVASIIAARARRKDTGGQLNILVQIVPGLPTRKRAEIDVEAAERNRR